MGFSTQRWWRPEDISTSSAVNSAGKTRRKLPFGFSTWVRKRKFVLILWDEEKEAEEEDKSVNPMGGERGSGGRGEVY